MDDIKVEDLDNESLIELMEIFQGMQDELDIEKEDDKDE